MNGYANDLVEICRTLELVSPVFIGHSASAMVGLLAGKGLRLFLVKSHVEALNGDFFIESQLGKGTTFTIVLHFSKA